MFVLTLNLMRSQLKNKKIGPASPPITKVPHLGKTLQPAHNATVPILEKASQISNTKQNLGTNGCWSELIPVKDPFIVRRKLKWCFPPGTKPSFAKTRVDNPAVAVPRAVFAIAAATITPSPSCVMCP